MRRLSLLPLLCFGVAWLVMHTDPARRLEQRTLDWRTHLRVKFQRPADPRIAMVLFEDNTDENLASWPPDRAVHGDMLKLLTLVRPAVVTWDVILDASREGEGDAEMARAAKLAAGAGVAVITAAVTNRDPPETGSDGPAGPTEPLRHVEGDIGELLGDEYALRPFPLLRRESWYGFADTPAGTDGMRRTIPLVVRVGREVFPSLALQTAMAFYGVRADQVRVRLGDAVYLPTKARGELRLPVTRQGHFWINYRYDQDEKHSDFARYSYFEVMLKLTEFFVDRKPDAGPVPELKNKIVFIGQTVTGKADVGPSPRSASTALVLVHANAVNNVLAGDFVRFAPEWAVWLGAMLAGYAGVALGLRWTIGKAMLAVVATGAGYVTAAFGAWITFSLWLPLVGPLGGFAVLQFVVVGRRALQEQHAREQVKQMFGTYLSPELLKKMLKDGVNVAAVSSERRAVTILFSDLRDFTALTERLGDAELIAQLNEYLAAMVECIHEEGGTLHKFIGDAVMAVWGDLASDGPVADAEKAVRAALAMQARLAELNARWQEQGRPQFRMGVGINHGTVLIGNIGSPRRMEFTAIGDAVNLASRLESLNKELATTLLVGESMKALVGERYPLRACGAVNVKGKSRPVQVYELTTGEGAPPHRPSE